MSITRSATSSATAQMLAAVRAALEVYESPDAKPEDVQAKAMEAALAVVAEKRASNKSA